MLRKFLKKLFFQTGAAGLSLFLAKEYLPKVSFEGDWKIFFGVSLFLAFLNLFLKPILNFIFFPLKLLTFGLISLILNMGLLWFVDIVFPPLKIEGFLPLFLTTLLVWSLSKIFSLLTK